MFNALVHDEWSQFAEDGKLLVCQPQSWYISVYLVSEFLNLPLYKAMMHVVSDKAW